jgi:hypothetical protein
MALRMVLPNGQAFRIQAGDNAIGRGVDNQIVLESPAVSRQHALLRWDETGVYLMDRGSTHGTSVDGQRLPPNQWVPLRQGCQIQFASEVWARLEEESARPPVRAEQQIVSPPQPQLAPAPLSGGLDLLIQAIDISLDTRKLLVTLGGTALAAVAGFLCFLIASNLGLRNVVISALFALFGAVLVWVIMSLTFGATTRMSYGELSGSGPISVRDAVSFALRRWAEFLFTPLAVVILTGLVVVAEVVILLIGRVPYIGEVIDSLLFLPALVVNLFLAVLILFGSSLIYSAVVDKGRGVFGTLHYVLVLVRHAPGRIVLYLGASSILTAIAVTILWALVGWGIMITLLALQAGLGDKSMTMLIPSAGNILGSSNPLSVLLGGAQEVAFTTMLSTRLIQMGLAIAVALTLAFPLVLMLSLACAVYLQVRDRVPEGAGLLR